MTSTRGDGGVAFERWLQQELSATIGSERGPRPLPPDAAYRTVSGMVRRRSMMLSSGGLAALGSKATVIVATALLTVGGAVAAAAETHGTNPMDVGQRVVQAVEACKDRVRSTDDRGIGSCVSAIARQQGEQQHTTTKPDDGSKEDGPNTPASPSPLPGKREGQEPGKPGNGVGTGAGTGDGHTRGDHGQGDQTPIGPHGPATH
jgi:hypothetical protein